MLREGWLTLALFFVFSKHLNVQLLFNLTLERSTTFNCYSNLILR